MDTINPASAAAAAATTIDRDVGCNAFGGLFQHIIIDLRNGANNWDDLLLKANKFHLQLKSTISSSTAFLDAFQKIADMATTTRGGTKEIGSALTRLCLRNRSVEAKLKSLTSSLFDSFISPLQDRVDEWKKIIAQIDKEHAKEIKRLKQYRKKYSSEIRNNGIINGNSSNNNGPSLTFSNNTFRIRKNVNNNNNNNNNPNNQNQNNQISHKRIGSLYDVDKIIMETIDNCTSFTNQNHNNNNKEKYFMLEEVERNYVRRALIEERIHYCQFFNHLRPVIEEEISMLQEIVHLEDILSTLVNLTNDPQTLPKASESFLHNLQSTNDMKLIVKNSVNDNNNHSFINNNNNDQRNDNNDYHSSPSSLNHHSRKSSISSMDSLNTLSTDCVSIRNVKSLSQPNILPGFRPKSIASQDSGFLSHDYNIPNIGRLVIYNGLNKINKDLNNTMNIDNNNKDICMMNNNNITNKQSSIICSTTMIDDNDTIDTIKENIEYATSVPLYEQNIDNNNHKIMMHNSPIYVNITANHNHNHNHQQSSYSIPSEGSLTPTNNTNNSDNINDHCNNCGDNNYSQYYSTAQIISNNNDRSTKIYQKPKPIPPKPPKRHSSKLSTNHHSIHYMKPELLNKRSTLIFVNNNTNNTNNNDENTSLSAPTTPSDFPPPPPEAYLRPSLIGNDQQQQHNNCYRYSIPNPRQLIYCNNKECLKDLHQKSSNTIAIDSNAMTSSTAATPAVALYHSKSMNGGINSIYEPTTYHLIDDSNQQLTTTTTSTTTIMNGQQKYLIENHNNNNIQHKHHCEYHYQSSINLSNHY